MRQVAIYLPDLSGGGAERLHVQLAAEWQRLGWQPRFLLDRRRGALLDAVPAGCRVDALDATRQIAALPKLARWLARERPDVLIANMEHMNVMVVAARILSRAPTRIVATQHNALSEQIKYPSWKWRKLPALYRWALPRENAVVAVSDGVAEDLCALTGFPRDRVTVIHNGVVSPDFDDRADEEPDDRWPAGDAPVMVGMGRLVEQKDHATLTRAFATIADKTDARLVILGEGPLRGDLAALAADLGLASRVALPGFVANPLPWLRRARLFVLSSRYEGFGNVLAEALACGTPVVSTDCPHGPAEILENGHFGALVPIADPSAMGGAMLRMLATPPDRETLRARGRSFTVAACAAAYRTLFDRITA